VASSHFLFSNAYCFDIFFSLILGRIEWIVNFTRRGPPWGSVKDIIGVVVGGA
jgi:hypothetical protein